MFNLNDLNPQQRLAAQHLNGPMLILAGAGSGKTRTITYRMAHMIANCNIPAEQILAVSFTNKAAREMQERLWHLIDRKRAQEMTLSTFHSLGTKILRREIVHLGYHNNFTIYDTSDQSSIIREALKVFRTQKAFDRKVILSKIGFLKNRGISASEFMNSQHFDAENPYDLATEFSYHFYQEKLKFYNAIDFDDILFLTVRLFRERPDIARQYSQQFHYIMIDEYQDTNPLQFQMVVALTSTHQNICVVGDDDQSIYSFRGADISNILSFEQQFPNTTVIKLEENYRSTSPILNIANQVIKLSPRRKEKTLWTKNPGDLLPAVWACGHTDHEAILIAEDILTHHKRGIPFSSMAVVYRSNTQALPLEEAIRLHNIPYQMIGGQKFYERKEIKDLIAYMALIQNPFDELSLRRILNIPHRGIGITTLDKLCARSQERKISLFRTIENEIEGGELANKARTLGLFTALIRRFQKIFHSQSLSISITALVQELNFNEFIEKSYDQIGQVTRRKEDVQRFIQSAQKFETKFAEKATLKIFLERLLLADMHDREGSPDNDPQQPKNEVTLLTLHSSKGLEFDHVYMLGVEEELLPHKKTIREDGDLSEERRLCYVGMTRARKMLVLTYCKEREMFGKKIPRHKSRFLNDIEPKYYVEQDRTRLEHLGAPQEVLAYKKNFFENLIADLE